jgi:hypothetical protein
MQRHFVVFFFFSVMFCFTLFARMKRSAGNRSTRVAVDELEAEEMAWIASSQRIGHSRDLVEEERSANAPNITLSLIPFICLMLIISGLSAWAIMFSLTQNALNSASASIQQQSVLNVISTIRDFNTPFVYGVQVGVCVFVLLR